jgi:hypothetical protein
VFVLQDIYLIKATEAVLVTEAIAVEALVAIGVPTVVAAAIIIMVAAAFSAVKEKTPVFRIMGVNNH